MLLVLTWQLSIVLNIFMINQVLNNIFFIFGILLSTVTEAGELLDTSDRVLSLNQVKNQYYFAADPLIFY